MLSDLDIAQNTKMKSIKTIAIKQKSVIKQSKTLEKIHEEK